MTIYERDTGYANMPEIIEAQTPFVICLGGRGTGKTYGSLRHLLSENKTFIYLRRTAAQAELISKAEFCPVVKVAADMGVALVTESLSKYVTGVYHADNDGLPVGLPVAYIMALSTMANVRSFDASRVSVILYDECIPEKHERSISHEADAFFNMYESIDRNRQLDGIEPVKCVCLANANNYDAPILYALRAIRPLEAMRRKRQTVKVCSEIGLTIVVLRDSPISAEKAKTALYRLTMGNGDFADMAIDNDFSRDTYSDIRRCPLAEYRPLAAIGEICLYRHKSEKLYYVSEHISGVPEMYDSTITERTRFRTKYADTWTAYMHKKLFFESAAAKVYYKAVMLDSLR